MRTFEERKEEIFRRAAKRKAARKRNIRILACCVSVLLVVVSIVLIIPKNEAEKSPYDGSNGSYFSEEVSAAAPSTPSTNTPAADNADTEKEKSMIGVAASNIPAEIRHVLMDESYYEKDENYYDDCCKDGHALTDEFSFIRFYILREDLSPFTEGLPPEELVKQDFLLTVRHPDIVDPGALYFTLNDRGKVRLVYVFYDYELRDYRINHYNGEYAFELYEFLTSEAVLKTEQGILPVQNLSLFCISASKKGWNWAIYCETESGVYVQCVGFVEGQKAPYSVLYTLEDFTERFRAYYDFVLECRENKKSVLIADRQVLDASVAAKLSFYEYEVYKPTFISKPEYIVFAVAVAVILIIGAALLWVRLRKQKKSAM